MYKTVSSTQCDHSSVIIFLWLLLLLNDTVEKLLKQWTRAIIFKITALSVQLYKLSFPSWVNNAIAMQLIFWFWNSGLEK